MDAEGLRRPAARGGRGLLGSDVALRRALRGQLREVLVDAVVLRVHVWLGGRRARS
jgi:hypothetical protein